MTTALDLFCGAGGASVGLHRSGLFDRIIGVDHVEQPDYPFDFVQADIGAIGVFGDEFELPNNDCVMPDFVWSSPPCQQFSTIANLNRHRNAISEDEWAERHPDLVDITRTLLEGHDWSVIENVPSAPIRPDIILEGGNVGIQNVARRRHFEVSWNTMSPTPYTIGPATVRAYGHGGYTSSISNANHRRVTSVEDIQTAFEVDWCRSRRALNQMVPPAYATYIALDAARNGFNL